MEEFVNLTLLHMDFGDCSSKTKPTVKSNSPIGVHHSIVTGWKVGDHGYTRILIDGTWVYIKETLEEALEEALEEITRAKKWESNKPQPVAVGEG